jgi:outer membrane translocation and assembly module TamA
MVYNNLEARIRLAQTANYILPGQLGLVALYDVGRVWQKEDYSNQWHNGVGGGIYFSPAQMALFEFVMVMVPLMLVSDFFLWV